ncbi:hypothetical protein [Rossellomorea sp. BNER]
MKLIPLVKEKNPSDETESPEEKIKELENRVSELEAAIQSSTSVEVNKV